MKTTAIIICLGGIGFTALFINIEQTVYKLVEATNTLVHLNGYLDELKYEEITNHDHAICVKNNVWCENQNNLKLTSSTTNP